MQKRFSAFAIALFVALMVAFSFVGALHAQSAGDGTFTATDISSSSGDCPTTDRTLQVPAVVGDQEGGLIDMDVSVAPGNGTIFTTVNPTVGVSTQLSEQMAVQEAFVGLNLSPSDCDVAFSFGDADIAPAVDGPSAGVAMTVALRAALTGKELRPDVIITGAILSGGQSGEVGGLIDKAQAASREGKTIFVTPHQELYESIVMAGLGRTHNFTTVQVRTMLEAFAIATSAPNQQFNSSIKLENNPVPSNLTPRSMNDEDRRFGLVAQEINSQLAAQVQAGATGPLAPYQGYFQTELAQNQMLAESGYAYTSANNAFISQADADFLTTPSSSLDVTSQINAVKDCLSNLPSATPTDANYEWVAGGNARAAWAAQKMNDIANQSDNFSSSENKYDAVRELYYARDWCEAAGYIFEQAKEIGGTSIDVSTLKAQADSDVEHAANDYGTVGLSDADAAWHLQIANDSLSRGDYLAAIYDAAYSSGEQQAVVEESDPHAGVVSNVSDQLSVQPMSTLWGRTYQSQGVYTLALAKENLSNIESAHVVLRIASALEDGMGRTATTIRNPGLSVQVSGANAPASANDERLVNLALLLLVFVGLAAMVWQVMRRRQKSRKK